MKILTWNCNGAFRKKFKFLLNFDADIFIIQECEDPSLCKDEDYRKFALNSIWIGNNKNKGLGVFAKESILLEKIDCIDEYLDLSIRLFLPIRVNHTFNLIAVWAHYNNSPTFGYIGQLWKFLQCNPDLFEDDSLLLGDFNSNSRWDVNDRWWNHSDVVIDLENKGLVSVYHWLNKVNQGEELDKTFFLHKNSNKGYHIDYCFIPTSFLDKVSSFNIGNFDDWKISSDHVPLLLELK